MTTDGEPLPVATASDLPAEGPMGPAQSAGVLAPALAGWIAVAATLVGGLARGKVFAVTVGTGGVGLLAQLSNLVLLIGALCTLGIGGVAAKQLAQARERGEGDQAEQLMRFLLCVPPAAGVVALGVGSAFLGPIANVLLGSSKHTGYVLLALASLPFNLFLAAGQAILLGQGRLVSLARTTIFIALAMTVTTIALVVPFGLDGAAVSIPATSAAAVATLLAREPWLLRHVRPTRRVPPGAARELWGFGSVNVLALSLIFGADLVVRSLVVHSLGVRANGRYQPAYLLSSVVFSQLTAVLTAALLPSLSAAFAGGREREIADLVRRGARLAILAFTPMALMVMGLRHYLVEILFNHSFIGIAPILALQVTGEVPRAVTYALSAVYLPAGSARARLASSVTGATTRIVLAAILLPRYGLMGLAISYVVEWVLAMAVAAALARRIASIRFDSDNTRLFGFAAIVLAAAYVATRVFGDNIALAVALFVVGLIWAATMSTAAERRSLLRVARHALSQPGRRPRLRSPR